MSNLKISAKIWLGFSCMLVLLLAIAITTVISSVRTGSNIDEIETYAGMQNSANELIHILNESRVTAAVLYETHAESAFKNLSKQLMYCDFRLDKLYAYVDAHAELSGLRGAIENFDNLYTQWRTGIASLGTDYALSEPFTEEQENTFAIAADGLRRVTLLAHEVLSNTISAIGDVTDRKTTDTKAFHSIALIIVFAVSGISLIAAFLLAALIIRSIMPPLGYMRDVLEQIGQTGDLQTSEGMQEKLRVVAQGRDETAQCTAALLVLTDRLRNIDQLLTFVAGGDLTMKVALQSERDTMGLAVEKMLHNLNQKFGTIAQSTGWVRQKAGELSDGSRLLSDGSKTQAESVEHLSASVSEIVDKIEKNTELARQAALQAGNIQENANAGSEQMNRMTQAAMDINAASQSIAKVIGVIDSIAFQTNILALNAAVEAARAGQHGKGFSVVAEEVRSLATKSADAAKDTGRMIEDTIQKAALGAEIAQKTSESLGKIVHGVMQSSALINDITVLSQKQSSDIQRIISDVEHVARIVEQNNSIASRSADAAGEISDQSHVLNELVGQFQLLDSPPTDERFSLTGRA